MLLLEILSLVFMICCSVVCGFMAGRLNPAGKQEQVETLRTAVDALECLALVLQRPDDIPVIGRPRSSGGDERNHLRSQYADLVLWIRELKSARREGRKADASNLYRSELAKAVRS